MSVGDDASYDTRGAFVGDIAALPNAFECFLPRTVYVTRDGKPTLMKPNSPRSSTRSDCWRDIADREIAS